MPDTMDASTQDLLPLLDRRAVDDWCADIDKHDILAILARVPDECHRNVAAIERAIATGNLADSKKAAHHLKGMAGNLGAFRLASMARDIELKSQSIDEVAGQLACLRQTLIATLAALHSDIDTDNSISRCLLHVTLAAVRYP